MQAHGKKLFIGIEQVRGFFFIDVAPVYEIEHPFRSCNIAFYFHVWPGKAIVLGWWKKRYSEEDNLINAMRGRILDRKEIQEHDMGHVRLQECKEEDPEIIY